MGGWEGLVVKLAVVAAAAGLLVLLVRAYARHRGRAEKAESDVAARIEGEGVRREMDRILAGPVASGGDLRARLRAWSRRLSDRGPPADTPSLPGADDEGG